MKPYFTKPDFCHSVLNVSATLAEFLGAPNSNPILDELQTHLNNRPQKLVCIVFDGMGIHPLSINKTNCPFFDRTHSVYAYVYISVYHNVRNDIACNQHLPFTTRLVRLEHVFSRYKTQYRYLPRYRFGDGRVGAVRVSACRQNGFLLLQSQL